MINSVRFASVAQFVCRAKSYWRPDASQNADFYAQALRQNFPFEDILVVHEEGGHRAAVLMGDSDIGMLRVLQQQVGRKTPEIKGTDVEGGSPFLGTIRRLVGFAHIENEQAHEGLDLPSKDANRPRPIRWPKSAQNPS